MNKKSKKYLSRMAVLAVSVFTAFGCFAVGCQKKPTVNPNPPGPSTDLPTPDPDQIATSTAVQNKTPVSEATIYYIGTPANGVEGDGKTANTPYSIDYFTTQVISANNPLKGGDIVRVCPGEHMVNERIILDANCVASYDDYVIFEAADPSQKTVMNFKSMMFDSINRGVQIYCNYVYWHNIDICGAGDNGLYIGGSYNVVENCEFYNNRDTGLQLGRSNANMATINEWPSYNLIKNCTSYNNYDNETYGENADGFAAKLTVGYGNIFDGCIAYRNSDDGWDLYGKPESGNIGRVILYNCVAFDNGYIMQTQKEYNDWFGDSYRSEFNESNTNSYITRDGDGNGFKLGGSTMAGDVLLYNCLTFNNRMHGVTDNSNPGIINLDGVTAYNNSAGIDRRSHLNIIDEYGETNSLYFTIASSGEIFNSSGKAVIVDSVNHTASAEYVTLDGDGYILDLDSKRVIGEDGLPVKGEHINAATEGQTVNPSFGHISGGDVESCNNVDIARTETSYNGLKNVLSVNTGSTSLGRDMYRGSAEYSILSVSSTKAVKIEESIDSSSYEADLMGTQIPAVVATDVFAELPSNDLGLSCNIHKEYRNSDQSINMGNLLKITDYSKLLGNDHKIGADLTKTKWEDYKHYEYVYLTDDTVDSTNDALLTAVQDLLYVPCDMTACYQDFSVVTEMVRCSIYWTSSDPSILEVGTDVNETYSGGKSIRVAVYRDKEGDKKVTLTAIIVSPDKTQAKQKTFEINVKKASAGIGDIVIEGVTEDGYVILYQNEGEEPNFEITNSTDYNGKLLDKSFYTVETEYYYAASKSEQLVKTDRFRIARAGVYEIKQTVSVDGVSKEFSYIVYVVSKGGDIDFVNGATVSSAHNGFNISGELSNVSGTLYALVSDTKPTEEQLKEQGVAFEITKDNISVAFEHDITESFTVYYGVFNPNGELKSEIYEKQIEIVEISTKDEFKSLAQNGGDPSKIYALTSDFDFTGEGWAVTKNGFKGVIDGRGHTISGIKVLNSSEKGLASVFYRLDGGSLMNINFDKITLEGDQDVGIFGQAYSGYLANIRMTNIRSVGEAQRIGGLVGHVYEQDNGPLIIDNVSLINTDSEAVIYGKTSRAGGIVGFIQTNSAGTLKSHVVDVRISNCYVDATIGNDSAEQFGGVVGTYDSSSQASTVTYSLTIESCVFVGTVRAKNRAGGIIGYMQGVAVCRVNNCLSIGDIYHAGSVTPIEIAEKNASGIFGGYSGTSDTLVTNCFAKFEDHNTNYNVIVVSDENLSNKAFWSVFAKFDYDVWEFVTEEVDGKETIVAPYLRLKDVN